MLTPSQLALKGVWKAIEIGDNSNYSKKEYPTDSVEYKDIPYIADGNDYHLLDVYVPRQWDKDGEKHPVIIDIHGGGWYYGTKELNRFFCLHLARKGFIVFNMSYRLAPKATWIEQVRDCMAALKFISEHMEEYGGDAQNVFLTGDSAGGNLSSLCAGICASKVMQNAFEVEDPQLHINALGLTSPVTYLDPDVAGAIWKFYFNSFNKDYEKTNYHPYLNFDKTVEVCGKNYPPTYIVTSRADIVRTNGVQTYERLKKAGIPAELNNSKNPKLMHVYMVTGADLPEGQAAIDGMTGFFKKYLK
ncbi:MAG: alpha/beta hydrolase [Clostridia bacterium]|nr:alpha/beta hydrolase [Clostridia bacterium]